MNQMKYTEKNSTTAEIKFYGYIGYWWINSKDFDDTIDEIAKRYTDLDIRVHCYGGEVFEGLCIHNTLKRSKLKVRFHVDGVAASMMPIVMFSGDEVYMAENAFQMFHAPKGYASGNSKDFFSTGKLLKDMEDIFIRGVMKKSSTSKADAEKYMDGTDYWLTAQECEAMKLITAITDGIDTVKLDKPDAGTPVEKIFGQYAAIAAPINNLPQQQNNNDMTKEQKQALITQHSLTNVTADSSDTAVLDAVNAKITALATENANLKQKETGGLTAQADAIIAAKEVELKTKFTPEQKTKFTAIATSMGVEQMKNILDEIKPVAVIADMITGGQQAVPGATGSVVPTDRKDWNLDTWAEKDPDGLEAMSKAPAGSDQEKAFNKLYNAKHNTQYPA